MNLSLPSAATFLDKVFKAELFGQMKETTMKRVKIDGTYYLRGTSYFIYTDSLPSKCSVDQNVALQHLLVSVWVGKAKAICEGKLCQGIDAQTVATTLALAEQHHSVQLQNACLGYLSSRDVLRAVKDTDGFRHVAASCPSIMMDILEKLSGV